MFIRWKRRQEKGPYGYDEHRRWRRLGTVRHCAYLMESRRVEGRPRQQVVCYLGSITDHQLKDLSKRHHFWEMGRIRLDSVEMDAATRERSEAAIAAVVPLPSVEDVTEYERRTAGARALMAGLRG